jgi:hypothetical protein
VLFAIGGALLGRFIPPLVSPSDSAHVAAAKYAAHTDQIRIGAVLASISMSLMATWGVAIAVQTRGRDQYDDTPPTLAWLQLVSIAIGTIVVLFMCMFWEIAAFRPGHASDQTVSSMIDIAYFLFLFTVPPFSIWTAAVGLTILRDSERAGAAYPRWLAYMSFWAALLFCPAMCMAFFKTGPLAWNGLLALYVPVVTYFIWLSVMSFYTIKAAAHPSAPAPPLPTFEQTPVPA